MPDELQTAREEMVLRHLMHRGIHDRRVLDAMRKVPRERFVPLSERDRAYADQALPVDCGQTISQPYIVALMTEAMGLAGDELVLEVGTGTGYQTAILAELAREVVTIERHAPLSEKAVGVLNELGYRNIDARVSDGTLGCPERAPFDAIIVTAAASHCPPALFAQLLEGGVLVIPIGGRGVQTLEAIRKIDAAPRTESLSACRFVPLVGAQGWPR
ncbi:MAG: protein-L-isoaspartate(D-aspartate) O-methyltransferase [Thermoguttaceae bacterium]|jgi:protein-L-isoaspartate(D-aspartate) O-methyltransferase|nr:protein-L-isoaspartate(D-aspartate) O-methyltransferase [Thermoguttaceae bacterium]